MLGAKSKIRVSDDRENWSKLKIGIYMVEDDQQEGECATCKLGLSATPEPKKFPLLTVTYYPHSYLLVTNCHSKQCVIAVRPREIAGFK